MVKVTHDYDHEKNNLLLARGKRPLKFDRLTLVLQSDFVILCVLLLQIADFRQQHDNLIVRHGVVPQRLKPRQC